MTKFLLEPILSEKAVQDQRRGVYHFWAPVSAAKNQVRQVVEELFGVKVIRVNSMLRRGKVKMNWKQRRGHRRPNRKRFLVFLKKGEKIKELALKETKK